MTKQPFFDHDSGSFEDCASRLAAGGVFYGRMANRTKRTDRVKEKFLTVLRQTCNVSEAARSAGIGRRTAYEWRDSDEAFAADWEDAEQEAADNLEREAWRRGVEGVDKPVTYQGEITATFKEYSDRMLELLLKGHRPEKYKDRREITGKDGGPIETKELSDMEFARRTAFALTKGVRDADAT